MKENNEPTVTLPAVGRIQGLHYQQSPLRDPVADTVELQYTDRAQRWHSVTMPLLDALYLANLLEGLVKSEGFESLRRGPPEEK